MYITLWEFVPIKLPVQLIWASFLNCNCQKMALKQDGMPFVLCPKQGSEVEVFVLSNVYCIRTLEIRCTSLKRTYAAVFPDPVFALAKISFPSRAKGMAFSCQQ